MADSSFDQRLEANLGFDMTGFSGSIAGVCCSTFELKHGIQRPQNQFKTDQPTNSGSTPQLMYAHMLNCALQHIGLKKAGSGDWQHAPQVNDGLCGYRSGACILEKTGEEPNELFSLVISEGPSGVQWLDVHDLAIHVQRINFVMRIVVTCHNLYPWIDVRVAKYINGDAVPGVTKDEFLSVRLHLTCAFASRPDTDSRLAPSQYMHLGSAPVLVAYEVVNHPYIGDSGFARGRHFDVLWMTDEAAKRRRKRDEGDRKKSEELAVHSRQAAELTRHAEKRSRSQVDESE